MCEIQGKSISHVLVDTKVHTFAISSSLGVSKVCNLFTMPLSSLKPQTISLVPVR
jgi:hypothetical protein